MLWPRRGSLTLAVYFSARWAGRQRWFVASATGESLDDRRSIVADATGCWRCCTVPGFEKPG